MCKYIIIGRQNYKRILCIKNNGQSKIRWSLNLSCKVLYFKRHEADIMKILHHPGICKLKEIIET